MADIPESDLDDVAIDPIVNVPYYPSGKNTDITYPPEVRRQVIDWALAFVKLPLPEMLGAKGMSPRPYLR